MLKIAAVTKTVHSILHLSLVAAASEAVWLGGVCVCVRVTPDGVCVGGRSGG